MTSSPLVPWSSELARAGAANPEPELLAPVSRDSMPVGPKLSRLARPSLPWVRRAPSSECELRQIRFDFVGSDYRVQCAMCDPKAIQVPRPPS